MTVSEPTHPEPGEVLPDFSLPTTDGQRVDVSADQGEACLVLIFTGGAECGACRHEVLTDLCHEPGEYAQVGGRLMVILRCTPPEAELVRRRDSLACPVLVDVDGEGHRRVGAIDPDGRPSTSVFITDRARVVRLACRTCQGEPIPTRQTLLEQLGSLAVDSSFDEP